MDRRAASRVQPLPDADVDRRIHGERLGHGVEHDVDRDGHDRRVLERRHRVAKLALFKAQKAEQRAEAGANAVSTTQLREKGRVMIEEKEKEKESRARWRYFDAQCCIDSNAANVGIRRISQNRDSRFGFSKRDQKHEFAKSRTFAPGSIVMLRHGKPSGEKPTAGQST